MATVHAQQAALHARPHPTDELLSVRLATRRDWGKLCRMECACFGMARLLFGQSAGSLSPAQAVQLAQAAAALSGRGPGVLDKLRRGVGLDVLSIESTGPEAGDTRIRAGRYISDRVFLKVEQGITQESREVGVEVRVLPQVTVEGGVGHEGNGRVGVNWRYDY